MIRIEARLYATFVTPGTPCAPARRPSTIRHHPSAPRTRAASIRAIPTLPWRTPTRRTPGSGRSAYRSTTSPKRRQDSASSSSGPCRQHDRAHRPDEGAAPPEGMTRLRLVGGGAVTILFFRRRWRRRGIRTAPGGGIAAALLKRSRSTLLFRHLPSPSANSTFRPPLSYHES